MAKNSAHALSLYAVIFFILIAVPITVPFFSSHDWQRAFQVLTAFVLLIAVNVLRPLFKHAFCISRLLGICAVVLIVMGAASALLAHQPRWAFVELALMIASVSVSITIARCRRSLGCQSDRVLFLIVAGLCALKCVQFYAGLTAAFVSGFPTLDIDVLLEGFSNKRFYGQFQTMTLPILALPLLSHGKLPLTRKWFFVLLCLWWMIAIAGGTRGTWLGMGVSVAIVSFCGARARQWVGWQAMACVVAIGLFWVLFNVLPRNLGIDVVNYAGERLTTSLSARDIIWHQAIVMIEQRPLLGFGPMQFADIPNAVAAHPHQAILQWASEWGIPSTILVCAIALYGLWTTQSLIRKNAVSYQPVDALRICLFASIIAGLAQAMVDGIIVMPYSQLWLAILVGWLLGVHAQSHLAEHSVSAVSRKAWLGIASAALVILGYVVVSDFPNLDTQQQDYLTKRGGRLQPRFWAQGVIATPAAYSNVPFAPVGYPDDGQK